MKMSSLTDRFSIQFNDNSEVAYFYWTTLYIHETFVT